MFLFQWALLNNYLVTQKCFSLLCRLIRAEEAYEFTETYSVAYRRSQLPFFNSSLYENWASQSDIGVLFMHRTCFMRLMGATFCLLSVPNHSKTIQIDQVKLTAQQTLRRSCE